MRYVFVRLPNVYRDAAFTKYKPNFKRLTLLPISCHISGTVCNIKDYNCTNM